MVLAVMGPMAARVTSFSSSFSLSNAFSRLVTVEELVKVMQSTALFFNASSNSSLFSQSLTVWYTATTSTSAPAARKESGSTLRASLARASSTLLPLCNWGSRVSTRSSAL